MVSGTNVLGNKLKVGPPRNLMTYCDGESTLMTTADNGTHTIPLYVSQIINFDDPAVSGYTITLTYTVTANP